MKQTDTHHTEGRKVSDKTKEISAVEHQKLHGNYRERSPLLQKLKELTDERMRYVKTQTGVSNKLGSAKRGIDKLPEQEINFYDELTDVCITHIKTTEIEIKKAIKEAEQDEPMILKLRNIKGIGEMYIADLVSYLDPEQAPHPSSFWAYVGYHGDSKNRYTKGKKGGGNKYLRTRMYNMGMQFLKNKNEYYAPLYYHYKEIALERMENEDHFVSKLHCHNHAIRIMMKHFLADLWLVWREQRGLPTESIYAEDILNHSDIIKPEERGW